MAFYTVRVDDSGKDIERPQSLRGMQMSRCKSLCSMSARFPASSLDSTSVRSSNPTMSIDKCLEPDASGDESVDETVPPLDLNSSGEAIPSESEYCKSFVIRKTQSDAYSNWLLEKRKLKLTEIARKKDREKEQLRLREEKKKIAEQKFQEWLAKKAQVKDKQPKTELSEFQAHSSQIDDIESNRRAWEQRKQEEMRRKREAIIQAKQQKKLLEEQQQEQRQKQATEAWENWIAQAPFKPKPVPLNRGFLTLKGTISDIFVNPNPWQDTFEIKN